MAEGNGVGAIDEVVGVFPLELFFKSLSLPFKLLSQLLFVFKGRAPVEDIDVDMSSLMCAFPFFHQELAAKGTLLLIAWFDASTLALVFELILLLELLTTLLLSAWFRGNDKGDNRSDDFSRFRLLWLLLLRLLLIMWLPLSPTPLPSSNRKLRLLLPGLILLPLTLPPAPLGIFVCGLQLSGITAAPVESSASCLLKSPQILSSMDRCCYCIQPIV